MSERGDLDPWDRALLSALSSQDGIRLASLDELAASSGVSRPLLEALAREGLLIPGSEEGEARYDPSDAEAVKAGLVLVEAGLPLAELLDLARKMDEAMRPIARRSVEVFAGFVRDSVEAASDSPDEAAERLVTAFRTMLPAAGALVEHHFRRLVIAAALDRLRAT